MRRGRGYLFTIIWGFTVWLLATLFFACVGHDVLFSPGTSTFVLSLIVLLALTALLLWGVTILYVYFDSSKFAALKFGMIGTMIGLMLDTFSIANHSIVFHRLSEGQVIAFTAWMSFAYALYLLIPAIIQQRR